MKKIKGILDIEARTKLKAGEETLFSGWFYTARDQAHKIIAKRLGSGRKIPFELKDSIIYYCGPTPSPPQEVIGSCGPTTSLRMDEFTEVLLKQGVAATVGKGRRSEKIRKAIKKYRAVYFVAPSGCGALLATKVLQKEMVAFSYLGPEAVYRLRVENFPLVVAIDSQGRSIY